MAKTVSNIGNQKQNKLNLKLREDEKRRKILQKIADQKVIDEENSAEADKIMAFQEKQEAIAKEVGAITGQYPDISGNITAESLERGRGQYTDPTEGRYNQFLGYDENGDIKVSPRDSTQAQENMDYNLNQQQALGAVVRPADYNLRGLDPALIRQMSAMNLSPGLADGTADAMVDPDEDMYASYPQMAQFAQGMTGETAADRDQYIDGLIEDGYLPIGEQGGVVKKLKERTAIAGTLSKEDALMYNSVYEYILKSTGDKKTAKNRADWWANKQKEKPGSFPAFLDKNQFTPVRSQEAKSVINDFYDNSNKLQTTFMNFSDPNSQQGGNPQVAKAFDDWMGEENAMYRPELMLSMLLAYYRAMEEASWADHSQQEYKEQAEYEIVKGKKRSDLWRKDRNRNKVTPQRQVLEQRIGDYIEEVTRTKFKTPQQKSMMGQLLLTAVTQSNFENHDFTLGQVRQSGMAEQIRRYKDKDGVLYLEEGYSFDDSLRTFLADSKGIRDLLQPNYRNHVRVTALRSKRDVTAPVKGAKVSGISPVRTNEQNIVEEMGYQLDPAMMNIFNATYNDESWHKYWNYQVKFKPQHWHILSQENAWIIQQAADGKTFYLDSKYRNSGRKGTQRLLMADMKPTRAFTISATHSDTIPLGKIGKKRTEEEDLLMIALSMMLGFDDKVFTFMKNGMEELFDGVSKPALEARAIGRYFNQLGEGKQPSGIAEKIDSSRVEAFGLPEGLDTVQALRTLDSYLSAKENNQNVFLTKFITAVDASQSGQSIQAFQMGNIATAMRGGLNTPWWMPRGKSSNIKSRLDLEKLYEATVGNTQEILDGLMMDNTNPDLSAFVRIMFGGSPSDVGALAEQGNIWKDAKKFAKRAVQGASYGQGADGAKQSVMTEILEWAEDNWDPKQMENRIMALETEFGVYSKEEIALAKEDGKPLKRVVTLDEFGAINFQGRAKKQLEVYADTFVQGMVKADPKILDYSKKMRKVFKTYIQLADFAKQSGISFDAPSFTYMEPVDISEGASYDTDRPHKPYAPGLKTSMLDTIIPEEWTILKMGGVTDSAGNPIEVYYEGGTQQPDLQSEVNALARNSEERSSGVTRFPVISIHGLDDLILSMAVTELKRVADSEAKKALNKEGIKKPTEEQIKLKSNFGFYMSVWDAGRVSPLMIQKFTDAYNKAFIQVMRQNRFFEMLYNQFNDFLSNPKVMKAMAAAKIGDDPELAGDVISIDNLMDEIRSDINDIESGGKFGEKSPTRDRNTLMGQTTLDRWADTLGWENAYIPSETANKRKKKANKYARENYMDIGDGQSTNKELRAMNKRPDGTETVIANSDAAVIPSDDNNATSLADIERIIRENPIY
jgi:hypothetical protein